MKTVARSSVVCALLAASAAGAQSGPAPSAVMPEPAAGSRWSLGVEALFWTFKASPTPVPIIADGALDWPGTTVLLGGGSLDANPNSGARASLAYALDRQWAVEGSAFYFPKRSASRSVASSGLPGSTDLLVPYVDARTSRESYTEVSFSPIYAGRAQEELTSGLWGVELNAAHALAPQGPWQVDVLGGLRYLRLDETYTITTDSPYVAPLPPGVWQTTDRFAATNDFYGVQIGARARYDQDRWFALGVAKVALGTTRQAIGISGSLLTDEYASAPGALQTFPGGYFALPTNAGNRSRNEFAVLPEAGLTVGYRIATGVSLVVGYSGLYVSNVVRPAQQVSRTINPTQSVSYTENPQPTLKGPAQPALDFASTSFWAQGVSAGLNVRF